MMVARTAHLRDMAPMDRRRPNRVPLLEGGEAPGLKGERFEGKLLA